MGITIGYYIDNYKTDFGNDILVAGFTKVPYLMKDDPSIIEAIIPMIGGKVEYVSDNYDVYNKVTGSAEQHLFTELRTLTFSFSNNQSFSVKVSREKLTPDNLKKIIDSIKVYLPSDIKLSRVKLQGERFHKLMMLDPAYAANGLCTSAGWGKKYTATMDYTSDITGLEMKVPIKSICNPNDYPPPIFSTVWEEATGDPISAKKKKTCSKFSSGVWHRRIEVIYLREALTGVYDGAKEARELPLASWQNITDIGQQLLKDKNCITCMFYFGECWTNLQTALNFTSFFGK